jgi:hypothetical protein
MLIKMQEPAIKAGLTQHEVKSFRQKDGLFDKFRLLLDKFGILKEDAINEIVSYAKLYAETFKADMLDDTAIRFNGVERLAYLMFIQDFWTPVPYILFILKNVDSKRERDAIFSYLESYLMRRIVCKSKNNNYSDMFSENLIGQRICTLDALKAYVNDAQARGTLLMPSDAEVVEAVMNNDLKRDAQTVLYMLESRLNERFSDSDRDNSFNVFVKEQIMPEKVDANWPVGAGSTEEEHQALAKTLGNFILLREKLKKCPKNATWMQKKTAMKPKCEELDLFKCVQNGLTSWTEDTIRTRNQWLAGKILDVWAK